jgi:hypothetical protein
LLNSIQGSDMISPTSFSGFIFTRAIDMDLDPPILQNPWATKCKKQFDSSTERCWVPESSFKTHYIKHISNYLKYILPKIGLQCFPLIITLSTNPKMKLLSGTRIINSPKIK